MRSTKHEIEMIQCNRQTTHLGTNTVTVVKHGLFFQFDSSLAKKKMQYLWNFVVNYINCFITNTSLNTK